MFSCAAWRKMPRCGLPAGFGEDDLSKTVEIMIRSYQISDHMTYIRIIYTISWLQSVSFGSCFPTFWVTHQVPELGPRWLAFRPWPCLVRLLPSKIWRRFRQRVMWLNKCIQMLHTYVRTYVYTYILTYLPTYIHTYRHTDIHTQIHRYTHTHTDIQTDIHTYIRTYVHT